MRINDSLLTASEKAMFALRALFEAGGYRRFAMSRFEEYDLYARYKDFLLSDRIITFTDLDGRLMALKPDVTLSVLTRTPLLPGEVRRVYYNENVYRAAPGDRGFREIMQAGVECIGDLDYPGVCETVALAGRAMAALGGDWRLCVSHLGLVTALFRASGAPERAYPELLRFVREKNAHGLAAFAAQLGLGKGADCLRCLTEIGGPLAAALASLKIACPTEAEAALEELEALSEALAAAKLTGKTRLDFSVVSSMDYYDGLVFQGFLAGLPERVLSGGQYSGLAQKLGRSGGAVGFAVYLDALEGVLV